MNNVITGRTTPNIRFKIQGILLCEKLNKHLKERKSKTILYIILSIIKYVCYSRIQQTTGEETWGGITAII
jgi:hypothetical protein